MSDVEFFDVVAFIDVGSGETAKRHPRRVGSAWKNKKGQMVVRFETLPVPGSGWTGEVIVEKRREQEQKTGQSTSESGRQTGRGRGSMNGSDERYR